MKREPAETRALSFSRRENMDYNENLCERLYIMLTIAELFIAHILWGNPGMTHVTPDGKRIYFLAGTTLMHVEAPEGITYQGMSEEELNRVLQEHIAR